MADTTYADPWDDEPMEVFWDDLEEWERQQVFLDGWAEEAEEYDDDFAPDLYDQYEYMLDHQENE